MDEVIVVVGAGDESSEVFDGIGGVVGVELENYLALRCC